jgi:hypothetical protein
MGIGFSGLGFEIGGDLMVGFLFERGGLSGVLFRLVLAGVVGIGLMVPTVGWADEVVLKQFGKGTARDSVGIMDAREDAPMDGPQAIYAAEDGSMYLLDQINSRLLRFDVKNPAGEVQALELPGEMQPTDVIVRKDKVYVWDGAPQALQATGRPDELVRGLTKLRSSETVDDATLTAFAQMGSQTLASPEQLLGEQTRGIAAKATRLESQVIASRGRGTVTADVTVSARHDGAGIEVREKSSATEIAKLKLKVRDRIGVVEFLEIDNGGRMFVLTENVPTSAKQTSSAFVVRYSAQGVQEAVYDIPLSESVALSRRFIAISPDGDVYFLRSRKDNVDLIGVGSRNVRATAVIDNPNQPRVVEVRGKGGKGPIAAVRPLTRQQVVETAIAFESVQWRVTPAVYGRDPDTACSGFSRVRRPWYLAGKVNQEVRGVPYCWGCHGSLNQFRANIANGMLAGNVCTHNNPRTDVAGVDCSAFVSATWGLATHFTTAAIPSITTQLQNAWDLQPGDALNKPGSHVMLFLRFTADRRAEVMEASTGGCNGRVCRNVYPLSALLARGYKPVRFRVLENAPATVAALDSKSDKSQGAAQGDKAGGKTESGKTESGKASAKTKAAREEGEDERPRPRKHHRRHSAE